MKYVPIILVLILTNSYLSIAQLKPYYLVNQPNRHRICIGKMVSPIHEYYNNDSYRMGRNFSGSYFFRVSKRYEIGMSFNKIKYYSKEIRTKRDPYSGYPISIQDSYDYTEFLFSNSITLCQFNRFRLNFLLSLGGRDVDFSDHRAYKGILYFISFEQQLSVNYAFTKMIQIYVNGGISSSSFLSMGISIIPPFKKWKESAN